jgi:hypothetical protein
VKTAIYFPAINPAGPRSSPPLLNNASCLSVAGLFAEKFDIVDAVALYVKTPSKGRKTSGKIYVFAGAFVIWMVTVVPKVALVYTPALINDREKSTTPFIAGWPPQLTL